MNSKRGMFMLDLLELEQFVAFADLGTLSKAAEKLHISQPTITRTMKKVENDFGVPLFLRGKNKIELNETGKQAAELSRSLIAAAKNTVEQVQTYHSRLNTIAVESCAPAPLWSLLPLLSSNFPEQTVSSRLSELSIIVNNITSGDSDIGILPHSVDIDDIVCIPTIKESLSICVPLNNELAKRKVISFDELNGFNCLLRSQIGFWTELCYEKMPASKFLVQPDEFSLKELIEKSTLPCFTTDLVTDRSNLLKERAIIPITDPEATVTYYFVCRKEKKKYIEIAKQMESHKILL